MCVIWLTFIISQADHRLNQVEDGSRPATTVRQESFLVQTSVNEQARE